MANEQTAARKAHTYALLAWNDKYDKESAESFVGAQKYEDLNNTTWAETSITQAIEGIESVLLGGKTNLDVNSNFGEQKLTPSDEVYDKIIVILDQIHNKWVMENAKKYDRGNEQKSDKNLYQHTPTALIGVEEVSKDLMFLAPFLEEMGIPAGEMQMQAYGSFVPNEAIKKAFDRYVEKYKEENKIYSKEDLEDHIRKCVHGGFDSLKPTSDIAKMRVAYMKSHISLLVESAMKKNPEGFGKLPSQSQPE